MFSTTLSSDLSDAERKAVQQYAADSTFFHACSQGRAEDFNFHPTFGVFRQNAATILAELEKAVEKSTLTENATLFSGFGNGLLVTGSLRGPLERISGCTYEYPGFISTTTSRLVAIDKFVMQRSTRFRPALLELRLPRGFQALDMNKAGVQGEFEFLLGRKQLFQIVAAQFEQVDGLGEKLFSVALQPFPHS